MRGNRAQRGGLLARCAAVALLLVSAQWAAAAGDAVPADAVRRPDVELSGVLHGADNATARDLAFDVPPGTTQVRVAFTYDGRARGTTLTLGITDPQRVRGWGGGVRRDFVVGEAFATPSFLPGPIPPGRWRLTLAVASIRAGDVSNYQARIWFSRAGDLGEVAFADHPVRNQPGWYRGDLHTHTGHSDALCRSLGGKPAPCPVFFTLQAAVDRGLDFVSVSDHNVTSQFAALGELQPYFDTLLVLPGREITTRVGHANLTGPMAPLPTDLAAASGTPDIDTILREAHATGGFLSINHPAIPSGEECLGCGWTTGVDDRLIDGVEVVNGGSIAELPTANPPIAHEDAVAYHLAWWEALLNRGLRLTGVGGSDNHDARQVHEGTDPPIGPQSVVGLPTTVVYATSLSQAGILQGLRAGRVFVDLGSERGRLLDVSASAGALSACMGSVLHLTGSDAQPVVASARVSGVAGGHAELVAGGRVVNRSPAVLTGDLQIVDIALPQPADSVQWLRIDVRDADGHLALIGNPIYLETAPAAP